MRNKMFADGKQIRICEVLRTGLKISVRGESSVKMFDDFQFDICIVMSDHFEFILILIFGTRCNSSRELKGTVQHFE